MRCYRQPLFMLVLSAMLFGFAPSIFASDKGVKVFDSKIRESIREDVIGQQIRIMPLLNKLNFGFGRYDGVEYYFTKTISRVFFQDLQIEVTVTDLVFDDNTITMELTHPILGDGDIYFVFSEQLLKHTNEADIKKILLNTLGDKNHLYVFSNPGGKIVHLYTCNHLHEPHSAVRMTLEHAEKKRYKKCGFCFKKMLYLPDLSLEVTIEREWSQRLSDYHAMLDCTERQIELQTIGEKILDQWPFQLLGYDYSFHLVHSQNINAFAIPTGKIIVTTGILETLENDEELEALLVLAIAHVEKRHSLKQYRAKLKELKNSQQIMDFASAAGSIARAFAGGLLGGAIGMVSMDEEAQMPKPVLGFQDVFESEASVLAALYFDIHKKNKQNLITLIRKLQFNEMTELFHPDRRDPKKIDLKTRIKTVKNTTFLYFGKEKRYRTKRVDKFPYELDLLYQNIFAKENKLDIYVTDKRLLDRFEGANGKQITNLLITDKNGQHKFTLDKNFATEDTWGVFLTFVAVPGVEPRFLQDIKNIVLNIGISSAPGDRLGGGSSMENFTFVEGKLEYDN